MTFGNMARWGKGRGTSLAVPLDNLFKENINCPSVARSAGVVGKWGITSFTSIRSAPYAFGSQYVKSQVQDQNSPLTVPVPTPAEEAPKPKKFFKSRNAAPEVPPEASPSQDLAPIECPKVTTATYGRKDDKPKANYGKKASKASVKEIPPDKEDIPKLKIHIDKSKHSKKSFVTKASKKEETSAAEVTHLSPNKRYLVRNRNKVINYSEDRSNSPLLREESPLLSLPLPSPPLPPPVELPPLKVSTPKLSPSLSSPTYIKPGLMSPTNKDGKPPIVLRISKGTSRLLSTDSEDILGSPNSDRHSAIEPHFEAEKVKIASPVSIISSSPKQEGIKITIKLDAKDRASKSKHEKSLKNADVSEGSIRPTRASKRNHHHKVREDSNEKSSERCSSPLPGSDNYELYRTLASPVRDDFKTELSGDDAAQDLSYKSNERTVEDIEMELEHLHSTSDDTLPLSKISKSLHKRLPVETDKSPPPEPKPPERRGGRVMRHRLNINYNEDNNFLDEVTTMRQNRNSAKSYSKKSKRKESCQDQALAVISEPSEEVNAEEDLIHTLSEGNDVSAESVMLKTRAHGKNMASQGSPEVLQTSSEDYEVDPNILPKVRAHSKKSTQIPSDLLQTSGNEDDTESVIPKTRQHSKKFGKSSPELLQVLSIGDEVDANVLPKTRAHSKKYTQIPTELQTEDNEEDSESVIPKTRAHSKKYRQSSPELVQTLSEGNEVDDIIVLPKSKAYSKKSNQSPSDLLQTLSEDNEEEAESVTHKSGANSKKSNQSPLGDESEPVNMSKSPRYTEVQIKSPDKLVFKSPKRICESANSDGDDKPSVKLVIMKKKGSIFKTRAPVNEGGPMAAVKKRQLYKHKWADDGKGGQTPRREPESETVPNAYDAGPDTEDSQSVSAGGLERITRYRGGSGAITEKPNFGDDAPEPYTSVRCTKGVKEYYTVVRNVKKAHQIQEIGEFQEFNDDVEYILDALQDNNPMSTRCLSAITLASKCTAPAFRMHVRAHGTVQKFFCALHDATNDQSLGLCTATVMFVLSQDRLNMDLDRESLELMLNLLESDVSHKNALDDCGLTSAQLAKNKERVRELCAEIKNEGKAKHLDLENITVGNLAMETLLSLTSKRAGEWFKEELRSLGGIDHIVRTIRDCCTVIGFESDMHQTVLWTPQLLDTLRKADRCMKVLENVTQQNEENQLYLVQQGGNSNCISTLARLYSACFREAKASPDAVVVGALRDTLLPTLKVLVNLSHSFNAGREVVGSSVVGEQMAIFETSLSLMTGSPKIIPDMVDFEFSVCVLLLLINLVQNNISNVQRLIDSYISDDSEEEFNESRKPAIQALIDQFYRREELARLAERNTDAILDGEKVDEPKEKKMSHDDIMEETVAKLLQKAGVHMEHTMVASYIVLLLGHIASFREDLEQEVRGRLPPHGFQQMRAVLDKYSSFLNLTASGEASSVAHIKATQKIMDFLDRSDRAFDAFHNGQDPVSSSSATDDIQSPASNNPHAFEQSQMSPEQLNSSVMSNNVPSEYNTSESDRMSSSMDLDTSFS